MSQMIPLPGKWRQRMRSYESLTFTFTPKLTQPVSRTVAWQAAGDDDGFSSDLRNFHEFPLHGWSFHLYVSHGLKREAPLWDGCFIWRICLSLNPETLFDRT